MKPIKDYFKGKDLKIEYLNDYINGGNAVINMDILLEIIKKVQFDTANAILKNLEDKIKSNEGANCDSLSYIYDMQESIDLILNGSEKRLY